MFIQKYKFSHQHKLTIRVYLSFKREGIPFINTFIVKTLIKSKMTIHNSPNQELKLIGRKTIKSQLSIDT